ncbi:MAG: fumarylacetoacetate hydrolase family protein [Thermodesulfobacteriota bacterium]|nr:fumarylacetoacetate hydrolase family protein [Thermodesulfobacteriota bacterium]
MKLATFRQGREVRLGIVWDDKIIDFNAALRLLRKKSSRPETSSPLADMKSFLTLGARGVQTARKVETWVKKQAEGKSRAALRGLIFDLSKVKILPPLSNPPKIMCLARNYVSHIREVIGDESLPTDLLIFMKPTTAIIGPGDPITVPPECRELDHEIELAVVIGQKGRFIPLEKAMDHVAGYTILNDISDREYVGKNDPGRRVNWFFMKAPDAFAPLGPYLVLKDEIKDPHGIRLRLWVNGELRQDSLGEEMIFKIPEIIARTSQFITLEPGDILSTGTPTGTSFSTQQYLKAGDVIECEIEGIGRLRNIVKVEKPMYRKQ